MIKGNDLNTGEGIAKFCETKSLNEVIEIVIKIFPEFEAKEGD